MDPLPPHSDRSSAPSRSLQGFVGLVMAGTILATAAVLVIHYQRDSGADHKTDEQAKSSASTQRASPSSPTAGGDTEDQQLVLHPTLKERRYDAAIRDVVVREDPVIDGWDTERFSELASKQLKRLGELISHQDTLSEEQARPLCAQSFRCQQLRPQNLQTVFKGPSFVVRRGSPNNNGSRHEGLAGFLAAIREQAAPLASATEVRFKFKIIRVQLENKTATTSAYFQMSGVTPDSVVQVNSTWDCTWEIDHESDSPRLQAISISDYEEVSSPHLHGPLFADCTEAAFSNSTILRQQLVYGRDHWYGNLEASIGVEGRGNGIAIGDVNGDGLDDIYFCQPAALPNRLFMRRADGSLEDVSKAAGVDWLDSSRGALLVDVDNDGDQDLLLALRTHVLFHENDGTGIFRVRTTIPSTSQLFSMNAVDYDSDGDLDLFVCGYSSATQTRPKDIFASPMPYHDANNGGPNLLLRNDGGWVFTDVTREVGLDFNNLRFSLASVWEDYDNDGDDDLYVANDFGRNNLYRNDDGIFVDVAAEAGVEDIGPGMSAAWGDYNNDGWMDLYVSNMFSSAGSRITHHAKFKSGANETDLAGFRRHARGNSLFENRGDGTFADRGIESGTTMGRWAWGSLFVDINNDGWRDVYVTNGFVTADNNNDL